MIEHLHKAFEIRISYADTGIIETHDMLQQMLNLVNMLILAGDLELARLVLNQYDTLVTDNEGNNTLDYGCCRLAAGITALKEGIPVEAEKNLLQQRVLSMLLWIPVILIQLRLILLFHHMIIMFLRMTI